MVPSRTDSRIKLPNTLRMNAVIIEQAASDLDIKAREQPTCVYTEPTWSSLMQEFSQFPGPSQAWLYLDNHWRSQDFQQGGVGS